MGKHYNNSIDIYFARVQQISSRIENSADEMLNLMDSDFMEIMQGIEKNWDSRNKNKILSKLKKIHRETVCSYVRLKFSAAAAGSGARRIYEAEMRAVRAVGIRKIMI